MTLQNTASSSRFIGESILILIFYFFVAITSIVNIGSLAPLIFFILLISCAKYSQRTAAIALISMFYLPVAGVNIPNIFIIASALVAFINLKTILSVFKNKKLTWIISLYTIFLLFRFLSILHAENMVYFWNYFMISFSVLIHLIVFTPLVKKQNDVEYMLRWWGIIGALSAILGYIHFAFSGSVYLRQIIQTDSLYDKATIEGTFDYVRWIWAGAEPNFIGLQLLIPLSINMGLLFRKVNLFNILLSAITFLGILGTYSRTSFIISILIIISYILLSKSKYKYAIFAIIPIIGIFIINYFPEFVDRIDTIQSAAREGQGSGRFPLYNESITNFFRSPIIGIGSGQTPIVSQYHLEAHNLFLQTLGENGIFGFIPLLIIFLKAFKYSYSLRNTEPIFLITIISVTLNCNAVSAFDLRMILSFVILLFYHYSYYQTKLEFNR